MSTGFTIYIILQFLVSVALIYGYAHEKEVIVFEDKLWDKFVLKCRGKQKEATPLVAPQVQSEPEQPKKEVRYFTNGEMAGWSYYDEVA